MHQQQRFTRKIVYLVIIFGLLMTLYYLGHPSTGQVGVGDEGSPGGVLAQMRTKENLDQAQIGQVDPTSEALKLAMFGFRGVAAHLLGLKAIEYKKTKDWSNLSATLNQITKIQPNFLNVWEHQAWNLAYNCSVEFDDYHDRYRWVIKGLEFLKKGMQYNENEPVLARNMGWVTAQKIGRADEKKQYRRLFIADDDYHGSRPKSERDNWLVGKEWYLTAHDMVNTRRAFRIGTSPLLFYSEPPMCQMQYGEAIQEEGSFGEKAKKAWNKASQEWEEFGKQDIPTSQGLWIQLGKIEQLRKEGENLLKELDKLSDGAREKLIRQKTDQLPKKHQEALAVPELLRTPKQIELAYESKQLTFVSPAEIARQATGPNRAKANEILEKIKNLDGLIRQIKTDRGIVNYPYWDLRAKVEQTDLMLTARKLVHEADEAFQKANLTAAYQGYVAATKAWAQVLARFPEMFSTESSGNRINKATQDDINHLLIQYSKTLEQRDELYPTNFPMAPYVGYLVSENDKMPRLSRALAKAKKEFQNGKFLAAQELYEKAIHFWLLIIAENPSLMQMSDPNTGNRVLDTIRQYAETFEKLGIPFPERFRLRTFVWIQVEHSQAAKNAKTAFAAAKRLAAEKKYAEAEKQLDNGLLAWENILKRYPSVIGDKSICREILRSIDLYRTVLEAQEKSFPEPFALQPVLDRYSKK